MGRIRPWRYPVLLLWLIVTPLALAAAERPNVVFILTDDLGFGDLQHYNPASPINTPNISALAAQGMTFTQFRAAAPICTPSRAAIMSGQDPARLGLRSVLGGSSTAGLGREVETLAEMFNGAGYFTAQIGKWHLGNTAEYGPVQAGFQVSVGSRRFYRPHWIYEETGLPVVHGQPNQPGKRIGEHVRDEDAHTTDAYTERAIKLIADATREDRPFYINLWLHAPHVETSGRGPIPWRLPPSSSLYNRKEISAADVYIALVEYVDLQVGRLMQALDRAGVAENTLIIFTSDNGALKTKPENYLTWSNAGLRGSKNTLYEGGLRVPFIARWPARIGEGSSTADFAMSEDIFPTFAELLQHSPAHPIDGISLLPSLYGTQNEAANRRIAVFESAVINKDADVDESRPYNYAVIEDGRWKLVAMHYSRAFLGLYDLKTDPLETTNLMHDPGHSERFQSMSEYYYDWSLAISRVPLTSGGVLLDAASSLGASNNQSALIDAHPVLDFGNSDFTLSMELTLPKGTLPLQERHTILERPGSFSLELLPNGHIQVHFRNNEGLSPRLLSQAPMQEELPTRIALTVKGWLQGSLEERRPMGRLYIDGQREDLQPLGSATAHIVRSGEPLLLGCRIGCDIRNLQAFNRTLTAEELGKL